MLCQCSLHRGRPHEIVTHRPTGSEGSYEMHTSRELRITLMTVNFAPEMSGIAPYVSRLADALSSDGHAVQVLTSRPHYPGWQVTPGYERTRTEMRGRTRVRRLRHYIPRNPRWYLRVWFELTFGLRLVFSSWRRPDVVVCVSPALIATALVLLRARVSRHPPRLGLIVQDRTPAESARPAREARCQDWRPGSRVWSCAPLTGSS